MVNELGLIFARQGLEMPGYHDDKNFELLDREWEKHGAVFCNPKHMRPVVFFTSSLPFRAGASFLEMGCGVGVTAVMAALGGCDPVTALDINPAAVHNAEANARRHGVSDRVRALHSDLFDAVGPEEKFDIIYWNSPYVEAPTGTVIKTFDEYACIDPGYAMHRTFLHAAPRHLTEQGRLFLGFSAASGNLEQVQKFAGEVGMKAVIFQQQVDEVPHEAMGTAPELAAHADEKGMLRLDLTLYEIVKD